MSYFAKVHEGIVTRVIVASQEFIMSFEDPSPGRWVDAGSRRVSVGDKYDPVRERFVPPRPLPSWVLDETLLQWFPPLPYPESGGPYVWNEEIQNWQLAELNP
jgi:hypothetical protein